MHQRRRPRPSGPGFGITIDPAFVSKAEKVTTI
jgi:hypothetical protein